MKENLTNTADILTTFVSVLVLFGMGLIIYKLARGLESTYELNLNQRESVQLKESVKKGNQEPRIHHQTGHSQNSHALLQPTV